MLVSMTFADEKRGFSIKLERSNKDRKILKNN